MTTLWFPTPAGNGRGRLRGAAITGLTIDAPRRARRPGPAPVPAPVLAARTVKRPAPARRG